MTTADEIGYNTKDIVTYYGAADGECPRDRLNNIFNPVCGAPQACSGRDALSRGAGSVPFPTVMSDNLYICEVQDEEYQSSCKIYSGGDGGDNARPAVRSVCNE